MYDFANSGYTTVIITAVFNAYFVGEVAAGAPWATFAWTAALAVSYALIIVSAPLIGALADAHAAKKKFLALTIAGCIVFTALLYFAGPQTLWFSVTCLIASSFFYGSGENIIAASLPELAEAAPWAASEARIQSTLHAYSLRLPLRQPLRLDRLTQYSIADDLDCRACQRLRRQECRLQPLIAAGGISKARLVAERLTFINDRQTRMDRGDNL
jgi:hypothetical protein